MSQNMFLFADALGPLKIIHVYEPSVDLKAVPGKLVAHYGGTSRNILFFGQLALACQPCDVMVSAEERGTLTRKGPIFLASETFLEHELGYGTPHLQAIGFPNERAFRLPKLLGLYSESLGTIQELLWLLDNPTASLFWSVGEISLASQEEKALADSCWMKMAADLTEQVVGVRDAAYLMHRYKHHPDKCYRIFALRHRISRQLAGLFVLRIESAQRCELLDVVGSIAKIPLLVSAAQQIAWGFGCNELFLWAVNNIVPYFGSCPFIKELQISVPGNAWTPGPANASVAGKWWLTGGDTDFH
jgi:hypothetical protein